MAMASDVRHSCAGCYWHYRLDGAVTADAAVAAVAAAAAAVAAVAAVVVVVAAVVAAGRGWLEVLAPVADHNSADAKCEA